MSRALLAFNPELQRTAWLELTPTRLIATPIIIGLIMLAAFKIDGITAVADAADRIAWLMLILWGTWLAADTLSEEITGKTWDLQRLSGVKPAGLVVGKLFGGTAFAWYAAAFCFAAWAWAAPEKLSNMGNLAISALFAQATALFVMFIMVRFGQVSSRKNHVIALVLGILFGYSINIDLNKYDSSPIPGGVQFSYNNNPISNHGQFSQLNWYGMDLNTYYFLFAVIAIHIVWLIVGYISYARSELGFRNGPIAWPLFVVYNIVFFQGFEISERQSISHAAEHYGVALFTVIILSYVGLLFTPIVAVKLKRLLAAVRSNQTIAVWREMPCWVATLPFLAIAAIVSMVTTPSAALSVLALLGFFCRDAIAIVGMRLEFPRSSAIAILTYIIVIYPISWALASRSDMATELFVPIKLIKSYSNTTWLGATAPWIEAAGIFLCFLNAFRGLVRPASVVKAAA